MNNINLFLEKFIELIKPAEVIRVGGCGHKVLLILQGIKINF